MTLYLLTRITKTGYDETRGVIVRARSRVEARRIAAERGSGDEGPKPWLDPTMTKCETLPKRGPIGLILQDFREA